MNRDDRGVTIIEVVMAIAILALVIVTAVSLFNSSTRLNSESGRRTQAVSLVNREVELLRLYRDDLRRERTTWASGMPSMAGGCVNFIMEETTAGGASRIELVTGLLQEGGETTLHQSYAPPHEGFRRIGVMCPATEYDPEAGSNIFNSSDVRTVQFEVTWDEANGPPRLTRATTVISNWSEI